MKRTARRCRALRFGFAAAGLAACGPRILRIRSDKPLEQADTLQALEALLAGA